MGPVARQEKGTALSETELLQLFFRRDVLKEQFRKDHTDYPENAAKCRKSEENREKIEQELGLS